MSVQPIIVLAVPLLKITLQLYCPSQLTFELYIVTEFILKVYVTYAAIVIIY